MSRRYNILYVDDEVSNLNVFKNTFRRDYKVFTAKSAKEGLDILDQEKIDLILTDQRMPEMNGVEFLKNAMSKYPGPSRILITAYTDFTALKDAVNEARIFQYIQKPWDEKEIKDVIDHALEIHYLKQKNEQLTKELKKKNRELEKLYHELVDLDKIKFQFLNIISHEIRTPLNGLVGATYLFKDELAESDSSKYARLFKILDDSVQRLSHFLYLAERITEFKAQGYKVNPQIVDLPLLIGKVIQNLKKRMEEKEIVLDLHLNADKKNDCCYAEKQLVEICLYEILDNAIKHSEIKGKIIISTKTRDDDTIIEISDNGPGFSEHVLNHIFQPFITEEQITKQGVGLDLALINMITKAHKGCIHIKNNDVSGATVQLIFKKHMQAQSI